MTFDHPVYPNKFGHQINYLWKVIITSFKNSNKIVFICSSFTKKSQGTKYGDQNVHFFDVKSYTPCIFTFSLTYMTWLTSMEDKLSNVAKIYNFMGV